jgi:HAMP domain-containing protein
VKLDAAWSDASVQMNRLLDTRIDGFFKRMWMHLGTALGLLALILSAVFFVARQIALPLRRLAAVTDTVRRTGDHSVRAHWDSRDEIGRLVLGFNDMLAQLDREREVQQELAANARAAKAQQQLVEAIPFPLVVTAIPGHQVLHANGPAQAWLGTRSDDPWRVGLEPGVRARFFQQLADRDAVNEFEVRWNTGEETSCAVGTPPGVPGPGRGADRVRADQPPEADGTPARALGQGLRGLGRRHRDRRRATQGAEREPRVLPQHAVRTARIHRRAARLRRRRGAHARLPRRPVGGRREALDLAG